MRFAFVYEQRLVERKITLQASRLFKTVGCFTKLLLYPEINNKLLVRIILHKSEGKPQESSLLRGDSATFCFLQYRERIEEGGSLTGSESRRQLDRHDVQLCIISSQPH